MSQRVQSENKKIFDKPTGRRLLLIPAVLLMLTVPFLLLLSGSTKASVDPAQLLPAQEPAAYQALFPAEGPSDYPAKGEHIGVLSIPGIGLDLAIIEDAGKTPPENAAVHPLKAPLPGEGGRIIIDADSSLSFKALSRANVSDEVIFKTYYGTYTYHITEGFRFDLEDAAYRDSTDQEELLLYVSVSEKNNGDAEGYYAILCSLSDGKEVQWK